MKVIYSYFDLKEKIKISRKFKELITYISQCEKRKLGEISIIFTSNSKLLEINRNYLKHNYLTDVITFHTGVKDIINGDIFISFEQVKNNAKKFKIRTDVELARVIIHGVLHLIGYMDEDAKSRKLMMKKEEEYLTCAEIRKIF